MISGVGDQLFLRSTTDEVLAPNLGSEPQQCCTCIFFLTVIYPWVSIGSQHHYTSYSYHAKAWCRILPTSYFCPRDQSDIRTHYLLIPRPTIVIDLTAHKPLSSQMCYKHLLLFPKVLASPGYMSTILTITNDCPLNWSTSSYHVF